MTVSQDLVHQSRLRRNPGWSVFIGACSLALGIIGTELLLSGVGSRTLSAGALCCSVSIGLIALGLLEIVGGILALLHSPTDIM